MTSIQERWTVTIYYRHDAGTVDVVHYVEELEDLQDLIELRCLPLEHRPPDQG